MVKKFFPSILETHSTVLPPPEQVHFQHHHHLKVGKSISLCLCESVDLPLQ